MKKGLRLSTAFRESRANERAQARARKRGLPLQPPIDLSRYKVIDIENPDVDPNEIYRSLRDRPEVVSAYVEEFPVPLYNPNDPDGLDFALTDQQLTHPTALSALDVTTGAGIIIGVIEMPFWSAGADYTRAELGGTGNRATDWAAIQAGTHNKFVLYTDNAGNPIDPYGT